MKLSFSRKLALSMDNIEGLLTEWCFIAIVMLYPLIGGSTILLGIPNRPVAVAYRALYLLMAIIIIHIEITSWKNGLKKYSKYIFLVLAFWMVYLVRMYHDLILIDIDSNFLDKTGFSFFFQYGILGSCIPAIAIGMGAKSINFERLFRNMRLMSVPLMFMLFYVIYKQYGFSIDIFLSRMALGEDESKSISPIILSRHGGLVCIITLFYMYTTKVRLFDVFLFLMGFITLVLGASRGPILAVILTVIIMTKDYVWPRIRSLKIWKNILIFLLIVLSVLIRYFDDLVKNVSLFQRIEGSIEKGQGTAERGNVWEISWSQFLESPIYGDAIVESYYGYYPHNIILEILMSTGLIGLLLLLPVLYKVIKNYFCLVERGERLVMYLLILFFIFVFFSSAIITMPHFWVVLSLVVAIGYGTNDFKKNINENSLL